MKEETAPADVIPAVPPAQTPPPIPPDRFDLRVLRAIRRIIRAADLYSHRLASQHGVTVPQLLCLSKVIESDGLSVKELAEEVYVSSSTLVGILDRLEARGWVERRRSVTDKRIVHVCATEAGRALVTNAPSPLHEELVAGIRGIPVDDQIQITEALEQLVALLEIQRVDAAPILEVATDLVEPGTE